VSKRVQPWPALAACISVMAGGCASEQRILRYKPFLANIDNAVTATPAVGVEPSQQSVTSSFDPDDAPSAEPIDPTVVGEGFYDRMAKLPDKLVTLEAGDIISLIHHVRWTLDEDRDDLLIDQLFSEALLDELHSRGQSPEDYVDWLHENRRDIEIMFARMPMVPSPNALVQQTAKHQYRVRLNGLAAKGIRFTELWVAMERGKYRLLWIS